MQKTPIAILIGLTAVALAIYLGLTYDKRTWMKACTEKPDQSESFCEDAYRVYPK